MANKKETRIRIQARYLRIEDSDHAPLKHLKEAIRIRCPFGFRAWTRDNRVALDFKHYKELYLRDVHDKKRGSRKRSLYPQPPTKKVR